MTRLAVLGGGARGTCLMARADAPPWRVTLFDPDPTIDPKVDRAKTISQAVADAELIVLAVPDRLALLRKVTQVVQAACRPDAEIVILSDAHEQDALRSCALRPLQIHGGIHADYESAPLWRKLQKQVALTP